MKRLRSDDEASPPPPSAIAILSLPNDVLHLLFKEVLGTKKRARWGLLATLRLVCRRFLKAFPTSLLRAALEKDFGEFVSYCIIEPFFPFGYVHFYVLSSCELAIAFHAKTSKCRRNPECVSHTQMICETFSMPESRFVNEVWWLPHESLMKIWRTRLYQTLLDFRNSRHDSDDANQQSRFYYALSSTYHTYFRGIAEEDTKKGVLVPGD